MQRVILVRAVHEHQPAERAVSVLRQGEVRTRARQRHPRERRGARQAVLAHHAAQLVEYPHQRRRVIVEFAARHCRVNPGARVHCARVLTRAHVLLPWPVGLVANEPGRDGWMCMREANLRAQLGLGRGTLREGA